MLRLITFLGFYAVLLLGCSPKGVPTVHSKHFELHPLADGVYAAIHSVGGKAICNAGIVDNGEYTLVFDSFLAPEATEDLVQAIESMGLPPVSYVVNSHAHNDHIRGNQVFSEDVKILSTARTRQLIADWEPENLEDERQYAPARFQYFDSLYQHFKGDTTSREYTVIQMWRPYYEILSESHRTIQTRLPDTLVSDTLELDCPNQKIRLFSLGAGHTESDLVLYLPDSGILFTGDLAFHTSHPYVAHGDMEGWITWLDALEGLQPDIVIPGHGAPGNLQTLRAMKTYLLDLQSTAQTLHAKGIPPDSLEQVPIPEPYSDWLFTRFYYMNLRHVYALYTPADGVQPTP